MLRIIIWYAKPATAVYIFFFLSAWLLHFKHLGYMLHCRYKRLAVITSVRKYICVCSCICVLCVRDQFYCVTDMNITYCRRYPKVALIIFVRVFTKITLSKMT